MNRRRLVHLGLTAALVLAVGLTAPAAGDDLRRAFDAKNAHKVDGRHAVGAGSSVAARRNKLVATNGQGRLPNNIIAKASDADRLDGVDSSAWRFLDLRVGSAHLSGGATFSHRIMLADDANDAFSWTVTLPPDYAAGRPVRVALDWVTGATGCTVSLERAVSAWSRPGAAFVGNSSDPTINAGAPLTAPTPSTVTRTPLVINPPAGVTFQAGDTLTFGLVREADSCAGIVFVGAATLTY